MFEKKKKKIIKILICTQVTTRKIIIRLSLKIICRMYLHANYLLIINKYIK